MDEQYETSAFYRGLYYVLREDVVEQRRCKTRVTIERVEANHARI